MRIALEFKKKPNEIKKDLNLNRIFREVNYFTKTIITTWSYKVNKFVTFIIKIHHLIQK